MRYLVRLVMAVAMGSAVAGIGAPAAAQLPWESDDWRVEARESAVDRYLGREGLRLVNGVAWLEGVEMENGVIEFDLAATDQLGFYGVAFRAAGVDDYEHFYLRPFQSGRPDATQYTPVHNGVSGWQIYAGQRYGLPVQVATDRWVHVRMVIRDRRLEVSVDGETLVFPELHRPVRAGAIGLTSSGAPARFANVVVTPMVAPEVTGAPGAEAEPTPTGAITDWRVSTPFAESRVSGDADLDPGDWRGMRWSRATPDLRGIVNLARHAERSPEANTVFAATTLTADRAGPVRLRFGFSDRAVVYVNGRPVYRGRAEWRSRDPRFLGTVGLFDEVILPLRAGENEVWVAVSEDFGGWGVVAAVVR